MPASSSGAGNLRSGDPVRLRDGAEPRLDPQPPNRASKPVVAQNGSADSTAHWRKARAVVARSGA